MSYIDGFVVPVPKGKEDEYRAMAEDVRRQMRRNKARSQTIEALGRRSRARQDHRFLHGGEGRGGRECRLLLHPLAGQARRATRRGRS